MSRITSTWRPGARRAAARRAGKLAAGSVAVAVAVAAATVASGGSAQAAATPNAQSVGRFLDGSLGGNPIQTLADLQDARAITPGSTSVQNPLDAKLANSLNVPLTGALQLPQLLGIDLGAANQAAQAHANGSSFGASGAVQNQGGVSVGGESTFPSNATVDLSASSLSNNSLGSGSLSGGLGSISALGTALGAVTLNVGALSSYVTTPVGYDKGASTNYNIAGLTLDLSSPALASLLGNLFGSSGVVGSLVSSLTGALAAGTVPLPAQCNLGTALTSTLSLDGGAIVVDPSTGSLTVNVAELLKQLNLDINDLPANTDLITYVVNYLSSASGLASGLENVLNNLKTPLENQLTSCTNALTGSNTAPAAGSGSGLGGLGPIGGILGGLIPSGGAGTVSSTIGTLINTVLGSLNSGQSQIEGVINGLTGSLGSAGGSSLLGPLGDLLKKLVDIGANVSPNAKSGDFTSALKATPDQATTPVAGQTVERALEVDLLGGQAALGIANSAAGPSAAPTAPSSSSSTPANPGSSSSPSSPANAGVPTGVDAGLAAHGGSPVLPLVLLSLGLLVAAGGGVAAWRLRGGRHIV